MYKKLCEGKKQRSEQCQILYHIVDGEDCDESICMVAYSIKEKSATELFPMPCCTGKLHFFACITLFPSSMSEIHQVIKSVLIEVGIISLVQKIIFFFIKFHLIRVIDLKTKNEAAKFH